MHLRADSASGSQLAGCSPGDQVSPADRRRPQVGGYHRFAPGPDGAPTVVLLHGWTSTADVTWHGIYEPLTRHFSVVAPDLRGHGRGPRGAGRHPLTDMPGLSDVASDVIALIEALGAGRVILVGYSMGGAAAQIVARRRPDLLSGMVLCASASRVCDSRTTRVGSPLLRVGARLAAVVPATAMRLVAAGVMRLMFGDSEFERWVRARTSRNRWSAVLSVGADLLSFDSRRWIGQLDVPSAVVVTTADRFVSPRRQHLMATSLGAPALCVDGDHSVCLARPVEFAEAVIQACRSVLEAAEDSGEARPSPHRLTDGRRLTA